LHTLSVSDVKELLQYEHLSGELTIRLHCLGNVANVTPAQGFKAKGELGYRWTESGRKIVRRKQIGHLWSQKTVD